MRARKDGKMARGSQGLFASMDGKRLNVMVANVGPRSGGVHQWKSAVLVSALVSFRSLTRYWRVCLTTMCTLGHVTVLLERKRKRASGDIHRKPIKQTKRRKAQSNSHEEDDTYRNLPSAIPGKYDLTQEVTIRQKPGELKGQSTPFFSGYIHSSPPCIAIFA